ncbi:MAG: hypothetical protein LQ342_003001 [Letrouitia transgressa]|nr:MAG: hypothetical protein LQ342_003001 [Letrouitia transgressa]
MVYWMLIAFEVVLSLFHDCQSKIEEQSTPPGTFRDRFNNVPKPKRQDDNRRKVGESLIREIVLKVVRKTPEDHHRHYTQTINAVKIALVCWKIAKKHIALLSQFWTSVIQDTIRSGENTDPPYDGNGKLLDPQTLRNIKACLMWIGCTGVWTDTRLPASFIMGVQGSEGTTQHVAGLDSGSAYNLISQRKADELGLHLKSYQTERIVSGLGTTTVRALGWVKFQYIVSNKESDRYNAKFTVLENNDCDGFDILLSRSEIEKRKFYMRNHAVLLVQTRSGENTIVR